MGDCVLACRNCGFVEQVPLLSRPRSSYGSNPAGSSCCESHRPGKPFSGEVMGQLWALSCSQCGLQATSCSAAVSTNRARKGCLCFPAFLERNRGDARSSWREWAGPALLLAASRGCRAQGLCDAAGRWKARQPNGLSNLSRNYPGPRVSGGCLCSHYQSSRWDGIRWAPTNSSAPERAAQGSEWKPWINI